MKMLLKMLCGIFISFMFIISVVLLIEPNSIPIEVVMTLYGIAAIIVIIYITLAESVLTFGPFYIILLYLICSCFGYDIVVAIFGHSAFLEISAIRHAYINYFNQANSISFCLLCSILLGSHSETQSPKYEYKQFKNAFSRKERSMLCLLSSIALWITSSVLLFAVLQGSLGFSTYAESKDWFAERSYFSYLLRLAWVSVPTYILLCKQITIKAFILPISIISFILIFTGNRNEAMYCLAMGLGSYVWRRQYEQGKGVPAWTVLLSVFIVFILNPIISSTRNIGLDFETLITGSFGVKDALIELGQQINPFSITLYAMDKLGYGFQAGMTILVPSLVILTLNTVFDSADYLYSNYNPLYLLERIGHTGRGYSIFSELYVNFGTLISMILVFLFSRFAVYCERIRFHPRLILLYFQTSTMIMLWVRNTIAFNITVLILAIIIDFIAYCYSGNKLQNDGLIND